MVAGKIAFCVFASEIGGANGPVVGCVDVDGGAGAFAGQNRQEKIGFDFPTYGYFVIGSFQGIYCMVINFYIVRGT